MHDLYDYNEWQIGDDNNNPVANFIPKVIEVTTVKYNSDVEYHILLDLLFSHGNTITVTILDDALETINWSDVNFQCVVNTRNRKAKSYLVTYIRLQYFNASHTTKYGIEKIGLSIVNNIPVYLAGNCPIFPSKSMELADCIEFKISDFTFDYDDTISSRDSYDGMKELIGLSPEIGRLLVAHTISSILRNAFKVNSFKPETVLVIVGKSGMFKTQYVSHMVQLYNRNSDIKPSTRFNSSKSFIENDLYKYCDCTAVIDDLHTGESRSIRRNNEITAEEIIRRISDDTGRGIKDGKSLVQRSFNGNVVFVGEYMIGKGSTVPRELIANITQPIDGRILYKYQNSKKLIVSTFYRYFIQWYVDNYTELCSFIGRKLNEHRQKEPIYGLHARLNDTAFYLITSYQIFIKFCFEAGFISEQEVSNNLESFHRQINELVVEQQKRYRLDIDNTDLLTIIGKACKKRFFRIADGVENFDENKHDCVIHYNCLCFYSKRFDSVMTKLIPNFNHSETIGYLKNKNALKLHESERKNDVKIYILRKRFYAIYLDKLK